MGSGQIYAVFSALPEQWWAEAITTAAYIHNRLVHTTTYGQTPIELWSGVKPDVSHMRVFGCICYAHVPPSKRTKTGPQSIKCLFIGYSHNSRGYRLYDIEQHVVIESRDVIFNENETPHSSIAPHHITHYLLRLTVVIQVMRVCQHQHQCLH